MRSYILFICCLFSALISVAQSKGADIYKSKLDAFRAMHPPAMLYFHWDKTSYAAGDSIRFKAYQIEQENWKPREMPQFVDIELIALDSQKVVLREKAVLDAGVAIGAFQIPPSLKAGHYRLKADSYLLNFDAPNIEYQYDFLIDLPKMTQLSEPKLKLEARVEGEALVKGILSKIIVSANQDGTGKLCNEKGDSLMVFPIQKGFGTVRYRPRTEDKLYIEFKGSKIALPEVKPYGITMSIDNIGTNSDLNIIITGKLPQGEMERRVTIMVENNGKATFWFDVIATNGKTIQVFPKTALRHGVMRFSLLDESGEVIAQRLLYHHTPNLFFINCKKQTKDIGNEKEITLNIEATDLDNKPIDANLSISVMDSVDYLKAIENQNIVTEFSIQQQFEQSIERLPQYFDGNRVKDAQAMDMLMLSQKMGRYKWEEMKIYQYKPLDSYSIPYSDERRAPKKRGFTPTNVLFYWNPELLLQQGKGTATFKVPKNKPFVITIEGFDKNGLIGSFSN
jgi:hypothetical protein